MIKLFRFIKAFLNAVNTVEQLAKVYNLNLDKMNSNLAQMNDNFSRYDVAINNLNDRLKVLENFNEPIIKNTTIN